MHDVFISHAASDEIIARRIASSLEGAGHKCWFHERDFQLGQTHLETTEKAIDDCSVAIVLVSENSISSDFVFSEILHAAAQRKRFIPVMIDLEYKDLETRRPRWIAVIGPYVAVQWNERDQKPVLDKILNAIGSRATAKRLATGEDKTQDAGAARKGPTYRERDVTVLSVEAVFGRYIEQYGGEMWAIEALVSAEAKKQCSEILARARAVLLKGGTRQFHTSGSRLIFEEGHIACASERISTPNSDAVRYSITTLLHL